VAAGLSIKEGARSGPLCGRTGGALSGVRHHHDVAQDEAADQDQHRRDHRGHPPRPQDVDQQWDHQPKYDEAAQKSGARCPEVSGAAADPRRTRNSTSTAISNTMAKRSARLTFLNPSPAESR